MQTVLNGIPIDQEEKIEEILQIIADKYSRDLLKVTLAISKPAFKIAEETGIPISTVYRRIQKLQNVGLVRSSGEITLEGKRHSLFQSKVREISAKIAGEFINKEIVPNPPPASHEWGV